MFLNKLKILAISTVIFAFLTPVHAKDLPKFKVEILVFESLALKGWTEEYWPDNIDMISTNRAKFLKPLPKSQNMLNKQAAKMTGKRGYHTLFHKSWLVQAKSKKHARQILIHNQAGSTIDGTLKFYKSRYPHVEINLELERKIPERIKQEFSEQQNIAVEDLPKFWRFKIKESRKLKSNELHYIDHPLFGALIQIQWQK